MAEYREKGNKDDFLREVRDAYAADEAGWDPIRKEGQKDIRYVSGDAWEQKDRDERVNNNRLCLTFDELGQYTNQLINDSLQNKRAIKVTPTGSGADDKEAQLRADRIRQIEYRSNAQLAYTTAFQNTVERSYGWVRINTDWSSAHKTEQEIKIGAVPNPDMITPGPHVMPDGSDLKRLWFREWWTHAEFKRRMPDADIKDFSSRELFDVAPLWIHDDRVLVCEYWAKDEDDTVCSYLTNGVEVLKKSLWAGKVLPFAPCYGKVLFTAVDGRTERQIHSLPRLAREPFRSYCYVMTSIAEIISQLPKFPYFVYRGSLSPAMMVELQRSVHEAVAAIEVEPRIPEISGEPPPFPQRNPIDLAQLPGLMAAAEAYRRSIQAAIGQSALPTQAQRRNEKSGVALKQIEDSGQRGSFHFLDHYAAMITRVGVIVNDLLGPIHDTARDMTIRKPDDATKVVRINDPSWVNPDTQQPEYLQFTDGSFDVTISTGPSNDSEREAQSDFADLLISSPEFAQVAGPQNMAKIMAKAIKLKNVGPLGDAIADLLDPPQKDGQQDPQQMQAQMQQAQQHLEMMSKQLEGLTETIKTDKIKMDGQIKLQAMRDATSMKVAVIAARTKGVIVNTETDQELIALDMQQQHEAEQNAADRHHEASLAAMEHEQGMQAADQQHQQALAQGEQGHQQAIEQGAMGHEQALEQGQQAADLAPPPEA